MQHLAALAPLALATYGLSLGGAIADHDSPAEAEQPTLAELTDVPEECDVKPHRYKYDMNGKTSGIGNHETYKTMDWIDETYYGCPKWDWM